MNSRGSLSRIRPFTPDLLIRRYLCGRPDPFRSVRDLGRAAVGCPCKSGVPEGRSSVWLPAWLPAAHDIGHRDALVLVTDIGPSTGEGDRALPCPGAAVCQPEKRKVGSSTLPLTTSFGQVSSALTSANADQALSYPQPSSDHDCPCVAVVGRSLSHADRTSCLRAPGSRPLRPELTMRRGRPGPTRRPRPRATARTRRLRPCTDGYRPRPDPRPGSRPGTFSPGCGLCAPPLSPIGLTAADPFAGGKVSRVASRVR